VTEQHTAAPSEARRDKERLTVALFRPCAAVERHDTTDVPLATMTTTPPACGQALLMRRIPLRRRSSAIGGAARYERMTARFILKKEMKSASGC
jgi:hypothetical protein